MLHLENLYEVQWHDSFTFEDPIAYHKLLWLLTIFASLLMENKNEEHTD